jgi:flagellar protein FliL
MRKILPVLLALVGLGGGLGGGIMLRPTPMAEADMGDVSHDGVVPATEGADAEHAAADPHSAPEFVKLSNQFVIPVLEDGRIVSIVIMSINLEVTAGSTEAVFALEPKLRDGFLQTLFDHANAGGFRGSFTDSANMVNLRTALMEVAKATLGDKVKDVLIVDIGRQDS